MSDVFSDMFILIDCVILSSIYWKRGQAGTKYQR